MLNWNNYGIMSGGKGTCDGYTLESFKYIVSPVLHGITNPQQEKSVIFHHLAMAYCYCVSAIFLSVADNLAWWETTNSPQATKKMYHMIRLMVTHTSVNLIVVFLSSLS